MQFQLFYENKTYQVGRGWYKVIILRDQDPVDQMKEGEPTPKFIVFIGEREDNQGMSVTNSIESIAGQIWEEFLSVDQVKPEEICWVECYPDNSPPSVDLVKFLEYRRVRSEDLSDHRMLFLHPTWSPMKTPGPPAAWRKGAA